ncbi:hypothetical protein [Vreelandella nigrificans]|uniref:DUF2842 domain-containing protein n=1 Tax=Vreelandella nigrificans TaxID=2042704 RepID=A0A2A4HI13_9GAMM|nr:hypothetical protein [Halomonas nigrificans]PCF93815.1 hypothetical protein CPA45_20430 [Halomonas nigrificans]
MRALLQVVSLLMLVLTVIFPMLYLFDAVSEATLKGAILAISVVWFLATPLWMGREKQNSAGEGSTK